MKGKIVLFLFALPFLGVGGWMLYSVGVNLTDAWQMQDWRAVEATLTAAGYTTHSGDDSTTYEAYANYTYVIDGRRYSSQRVGISGGADNIGSFQETTGNRLRQALRQGQTIIVYVNPEDPTDAVIDREIRWGMVAFKSMFALVFGGVGLVMLIAGFSSAPDRAASDPRIADQPWLLNDAWQTAAIRSGSKSGMYFAWGFAAFWNLISAPLPFLIREEVLEKDNLPALLGLLFPLVGVGLLVWAIRRTLEWRRFGPTPVTLDPFPGAIGGQVGGTIDVNLTYAPDSAFKLTLTSIRSAVSGSGKNRSRTEKATWQDSLFAYAEPGARGTRLTFRFDVPQGLAESDARRDNDSYQLWRLNLSADLPGADLDRDYDIPVYATGEESRHLPKRVLQRARVDQVRVDDEAVRDRVTVDSGFAGRRIRFPMGRNLGASIGGFIVGAMFAGAGWYLIVAEGQRIFGGLFAGVGVLVALGTLYLSLNSLTVYKDGSHLHTVRRILGIPVRRTSTRSDGIVRFSKHSTLQTRSGSTPVMHYSIYVHDDAGNRVCVGEGFRGDNEADAAIRLLGRELSLAPRREPRANQPDAEYDALAADN